MHGEELEFQDSFRRTLGRDWTWIREDEQYWRCTAQSDGLVIDALPGGLWSDSQIPVKNLLIRDLISKCAAAEHQPSHPEERIRKEYCLSYAVQVLLAFEPECWGDQAGLIMYNSDQYWIKLVIEGNKAGGANLVFANRLPDQAAKVIEKKQMPTGHSGYLRLRLEISSDGQEVAALYEYHDCLRLIGKLSSGSCPRKIGLIAHCGGDIDLKDGIFQIQRRATFQDFHILQLADDRIKFIGKHVGPISLNKLLESEVKQNLSWPQELPLADMPAQTAFSSMMTDGSSSFSGWTFSNDLDPEDRAAIMDLIGQGVEPSRDPQGLSSSADIEAHDLNFDGT